MSRIALAFSCFFKLLFGGKLPAEAAAYLPPGSAPPQPPAALPAVAPVVPKPEKPAPRVVPVSQVDGALAMLALLQREGRLIDFLRESIDAFSDSDIGAAARDVHRGCKKVLEQHVTLEPVIPGQEEERVTVPKGFNPSEIRLIGEAKGEAPFTGTLRHKGWRATETKLPTLSEGVDRTVLAPAEVEV